MRKAFYGGNWKCNGTLDFVRSHMNNVINNLKFDKTKCEVVVAPINVHLSLAASLLAKNSDVQISSQNLSFYKEGAYTGEVTAKQLKDMGINWAIIGHSERRAYFHDSSPIVGQKVLNAVSNNVGAIACIGETLSERESNQTFNVVYEQIGEIAKMIKEENWSNVVVAYEPVWAIGTGKTETPEQAQEVCMEIRNWMSKNVSSNIAKSTRIIYGGSVNDKNANSLMGQKDIDGFLVGGASLKPDFSVIVDSYKNNNI